MPTPVGPSLVAQCSTLSFSTTNTLRNEAVNIGSISANYVIDVDGLIYQNQEATTSATVTLVGGLDTFANTKKVIEPKFFMTEKQKITVYNILRALSVKTDSGDVSSGSEDLNEIVKAIYFNYCG